MAEIKNSFLASKMNKDLDDRLIPNGEYRDASNISVGKSEDDDIGTLESILGNACMTDFIGGYTTTFVTSDDNLTPGQGDHKIILNSTTSGLSVGMDIYYWPDNVNQNGTKYLSKLSWWSTTSGITTLYLQDPLPIGLAVDQRIVLTTPVRVIGYHSDEARQRMYLFLTDYVGTEVIQPDGYKNYIYIYEPNTNIFTPLVNNKSFLNFSTANPISGTSLIEDLLFFTDNRNQPRKVNVTRSSNYYNNEASVSVAKYNPYEPISLVKTAKGTIASGSASSLILNTLTTGVCSSSSGTTLDITGLNYNIKPNQVVASTTEISAYVIVEGVTYISGATRLTLSSSQTITPGEVVGFYPGFEIKSSIISTTIGYDQFLYINGWTPSTGTILLNLPITGTIVANESINFLISTMSNKDTSTTWPGDPDYLESRFVRFSYRFKYDDGEYSIIAPFTQIAYIPKQQGYFVGTGESSVGAADQTPKDEDAAYRSTILNWMENNVQNIELIIPLPDIAKNLGVASTSTYKISGIDILYKESEALSVKVLDSVDSTEFSSINKRDLDYYVYDYQSRKPYKTLPSIQTTRVYDMVPTRALAQETSGNRVIYGNFWNQHTPPSLLDYEVGIAAKQTDVNEGYTNWVEYPNHSLKQDRNYQVGFILADKWGRQSSVILSSVRKTESSPGNITYGGSTVYSPYNINQTSRGEIAAWTGDALQLQVSSIITSGRNSTQVNATIDGDVTASTNVYINTTGNYNLAKGIVTFPHFEIGMLITGGGSIPVGTRIKSLIPNTANGFVLTNPITTTDGSSIILGGTQNYPDQNTGQPGLYAIPSGTGSGFNIYGTTATIQNLHYIFTLDTSGGGQNPPTEGDIMKGEYEDYVSVNGVTKTGNQYDIVTSGEVNNSFYLNRSLGLVDNKYSYIQNSTGWYSYKIVVRQQEQEYYNIYLPGILSGYPNQLTTATNVVEFPTDPAYATANIVLFNDNINKVPRDLAEVGPEQKQFRSSVQLSGRVTNTVVGTSASASKNNLQYFPGIKTDTAISIATATDSNMAFEVFQDNSSNEPILYSSLSTQGQANLYQLDTNPLIARLSTDSNNPIGVASQGAGASVNLNMLPYLAIYETEPVESLIDIYWETTTVGLISDLNSEILNTFDGPTGFTAIGFNLNESKIPVTDAVIVPAFYPVNSGGVSFVNRSTMSMSVTDGNGDPFAGFTLLPDTGSGYSIIINQFFTYTHSSAATDTYQFSFNVSINVDGGSGSGENGVLSFTGSLDNIVPIFNAALTAGYLPAISVTPTVTALGTLNAKNGTADTDSSVNTQQLRWRITSGNSAGYFALGEQTGVFTKTSTSTPAGSYDLEITLEDSWNGSTQGDGFGSIVVNQIVNVSSSQVGYFFYGGPNTVFLGACPAQDAEPVDCSSILYYSQSTLSGGLPTAGSEIRTGPLGTGSPLAAAGYYSIGQCATGASRTYMFIQNSDGIVSAGFPKSCNA